MRSSPAPAGDVAPRQKRMNAAVPKRMPRNGGFRDCSGMQRTTSIFVSPPKTAIENLHDPRYDTTIKNETGGAICISNSMTAVRSLAAGMKTASAIFTWEGCEEGVSRAFHCKKMYHTGMSSTNWSPRPFSHCPGAAPRTVTMVYFSRSMIPSGRQKG